MALLTEKQKDELKDRIRQIETRTDAEIVMVLAKRSDNYGYAPTLFAACTSMLIPLVSLYWPFWLSTSEVVSMQLIAFIVLTILFRIPNLLRLVVPRRTKYFRASNMAMRQFLTQRVHTTQDNLGCLIFVSELERYIEIVSDHGLAEIDNAIWENAVTNAIPLLKQGEIESSFVNTIETVGSVLIEHFPASKEKKGLPDHLIEV